MENIVQLDSHFSTMINDILGSDFQNSQFSKIDFI